MGLDNLGKGKESIQKRQGEQSIVEQREENEKPWLQQMLERQQKLQRQLNQQMQAVPPKDEKYQKLEASQKNEVRQKSESQQKSEVRQQTESQPRSEVRQESGAQQKKIDEKKNDEFQALVKQHQNEDAQQEAPSLSLQRVCEKPLVNEKVNESKQQIQQELLECSKTIRNIQRTIKETYQFKPCGQLCEVLINIRQNVYKKAEDIQEDLEYVIEAFGIDEFVPKSGDIFEAKCHDQVYSNVQDARGKEIEQVYSSGFKMDGEVIVKAQVSVK